MVHFGAACGITAFFLVATSTDVVAQPMSKDDYIVAKRDIGWRYTVDRMACDVLGGNARGVCIAEVKGRERVSEAELFASYQPSVKTRFAVVIAKADAAFAISRKKCEDMHAHDRDVCMKEARDIAAATRADGKSAEAKAEADATATGRQ